MIQPKEPPPIDREKLVAWLSAERAEGLKEVDEYSNWVNASAQRELIDNIVRRIERGQFNVGQ